MRRHLSFANVTASLALFIALGGTSYAVTQLPKNSVGNKQLKANAVTSSKVKNGSLLAGDFKAGQLPAGAPGPKGDTGAKGDPGPKGDPGTDGIGPAYITTNQASTGLGDSSSPTNLATLSLPAGRYTLTGETLLDNGNSGSGTDVNGLKTGRVECRIVRNSTNDILAVDITGLGDDRLYDDEDTLTITGAVDLPAAETVTLRCNQYAGPATAMTSFFARLMATRVKSIVTQ